jgi:hypothetical protein
MIHRRKKRAIGARAFLVLYLQRRWPRVLFVRPGKFLGRRLGFSSAGPIEADMVHRRRVDRLVIGVGDDGRIHSGNSGIVKEHPVIPIAALVTRAGVSEAVVDAAVITDMRSPISGVPNVPRTLKAPVARSPQQTHSGWDHPGAGHPVITI